MSDLPAQFVSQMGDLLGKEAFDFLSSLVSSSVIGLRTNTLKISPVELKKRLPYPLLPIPWTPSGFWMSEQEILDLPRPGRHPYHAAGLYYLQDPSAMVVAELLDPQPGELVMDLCAAPGGKTTHIGSLMNNHGILIANETHPRRVWELAGNLERCGVRNAVVTNETPTRLMKHFGPVFNRVLVDAPCSGEAMFHKSPSARRDWSPRLVQSCSLRQSAILETAAELVRPGGVLVYSTCTFNPCENERVVAHFLAKRPDYRIQQVKTPPHCSPGQRDWLQTGINLPEIAWTIRYWPHRAVGDGHFVAVLIRLPEHRGISSSRSHYQPFARCPASVQKLFEQFSLNTFKAAQAENYSSAFPPTKSTGTGSLLQPPRLESSTNDDLHRLALVKDHLYCLPEQLPDLGDLRLIHPGWLLGTVKTSGQNPVFRFEPSHALAMGLHASSCLQTTGWSTDDFELIEFLQGNPLPSPGEDGWILATVDGYAIGWGKRVGNILKNHYPKGLRWN